MPIFLLGALVGGGGIWYASNAGEKITKLALVAGAGYLGYKFLLKK